MANPINEFRLVLVRSVLKIKNGKKISLGVNFRVRRRFNCLIRNAKVSIGDNVSFNNDCSITALGKISIGDNTIFGENVRIYDHNHRFHLNGGLFREQEMSVGSVEIGNNCWIGSNVVLLSGTKIGNNCVIGAGCVIDCSVPDNTLVKAERNLEFIPIV